jgi:hypothetical protein
VKEFFCRGPKTNSQFIKLLKKKSFSLKKRVKWRRRGKKFYHFFQGCVIFFVEVVVVQIGAISSNIFWTKDHSLIQKIVYQFISGFKTYTFRKGVFFFVRIQVHYRKSVKIVTFSSINYDLLLKKKHFFQKKNIFDFKKRTNLAPLRYWT